MNEEGDKLIEEETEQLAGDFEFIQSLAGDIEHRFVGQMAQIELDIAHPAGAG